MKASVKSDSIKIGVIVASSEYCEFKPLSGQTKKTTKLFFFCNHVSHAAKNKRNVESSSGGVHDREIFRHPSVKLQSLTRLFLFLGLEDIWVRFQSFSDSTSLVRDCNFTLGCRNISLSCTPPELDSTFLLFFAAWLTWLQKKNNLVVFFVCPDRGLKLIYLVRKKLVCLESDRVEEHVYIWAVVSVSKHYKNPTKRVGREQSGLHSH
jgi:hypothetical protein